MQKTFLGIALLGLFTLLLIVPNSGCYYDSEEALYGGGCDTTGVRFAADIVPIMEKNCYNCHDATTFSISGTQFDSYNLIKIYVASGSLIERINDNTNPMPPSGKLNTCNINKITAWVNAGALNN